MFLLVIHVVLLPTQHLCFDTQKFYWVYAASPVHILYGRRLQCISATPLRGIRSPLLRTILEIFLQFFKLFLRFLLKFTLKFGKLSGNFINFFKYVVK